jgi:hypothetical protein
MHVVFLHIRDVLYKDILEKFLETSDPCGNSLDADTTHSFWSYNSYFDGLELLQQ